MNENETKNTTILAMDIVGYSAKMNIDEKGTTDKLKNARSIIEKLVKLKSGRIFNTAGDSFMVEFNSTYNAVYTAINIQKKLHEINNKLELNDKLEFRMGVNLGDVIIDGTNLLGDGVNVAARLESIAPPGGICVSEIVYNLVKSKIHDGFLNKGKQKLKNIKEKITCYYIDIKTGSVDPKTFKPKSTEAVTKSIISAVAASLIGIVIASSYFLINKENEKKLKFNILAVAPIQVVSEDQDQINLAFGLTENLSGRLNSAAKKLNVVTLNEKPEDIKNLEKQIGAKYLISGSLQKVLDTIRISIKLIDTETLSAVWSENFDKKYTAENIFSLQDEIVSNVVDALVGNGAILAQEVAKNIGKSGTNNLNAYECVNFVRGQYFKILSPQMHTEGLSCLRRSVLEDPEYKEAWQLLAHMLSWGYALYVPFLQPVSLDGLDEAEKAIDQAIRIDKDFARAYATRAELAFHKRDWSRLVEYAKKAYELGPLDAANVGHLSYLLTSSGSGCNAKPEVKVKFKIDDGSCYRLEWGGELAAEGNQLDAVSSLSFDNYGLGTYNRGIKNWQGMLEAFEAVPTPDFHLWNLWIGIAHHNLGNTDKAKEYFDACKKLYSENLFEKLRIVESVWHFEVLYEDEEVYKYMKDVYNWE